MNEVTCFSREELRCYLLGELPESALGDVASHVEHCAECEATVSALDRESDTLIESLREPVTQEEPASVYRLAAQRAKAFWSNSASDSPIEDSHESGIPRLRDYELLEPLARGGMGTVYRARHLRLNREVALKVLPGRWLRDPVVVARFEREMQSVGSLRHPAIVQATDGGEANGVHFLAMELIDGFDGGALVQLLGPLPVADACEIARQAAVGMAYVHEQGVVHRDLKPSNLMVTNDGEVKVLDLGLARVIGAQLADDELTTVGQLMGTIDFTAPEQLENSHDVDERTDVYSLGATLYKLLTGHSPHTGEQREPLLSKLRRIAAETPTSLHDRRTDAPAELCELVDNMLSHDASDRPASMNSVITLLVPFVESSDLAGQMQQAAKARRQRERLAPAPSKLTGKEVSQCRETRPKSQVSESQRPHNVRWVAWCVAGLLLLAAAMGVVITLQTSAAQLVIETSSPDVEVRVLKAGQPHRQLTVTKQAASLRLGAGEYEIEIVGKADGLEIENGKYTLKRGDTWLAKIVHRQSSNRTGDTTAPFVMTGETEKPPVGPTYEGKTLDQWLALLGQERSPKQFFEACQALEKLATGDDTEQAVAAVLLAIQFHDRNAVYIKGENQVHRLWEVAEELFQNREQDIVVDVLTKQLDQRDDAYSKFILEYLSHTADDVRPVVTERLLTHVERFVTDQRSQHRYQAIGVLLLLATEEVATRRLLGVLSDRDADLQLYAARELVKMQSNTPLVVSTLRSLMRSGELRHRAEAAWRLGDLGEAARPALPDLISIVEDQDGEISWAAAFRTDSYPYNRTSGRYFVSVKDAAIHTLAEIGDKSVMPVLTSEWERRAFGKWLPGTPQYGWKPASGQSISSTHEKDWVADAIEQLSELRPEWYEHTERGNRTVWEFQGTSLVQAYSSCFGRSRSVTLPDAMEVAKKVIDLANDFEKEEAQQSIKNATGIPTRHEAEYEVQLAELLAAADDPALVLQSLLRRWYYVVANPSDDWTPEEYTSINNAYHDCLQRIVMSTKEWRTLLLPHIVAAAADGNWPAGALLVDLVPELTPEQQLANVVRVLQLVGRHGKHDFEDSIAKLKAWSEDEVNRAALHEGLKESRRNDWYRLVSGMCRAGLADDVVRQAIKTRVSEDSINRLEVLGMLVPALDGQPDLADLVIELIADPAFQASLNELRREIIEHYRDTLADVPPQLRPQFIPLLQRLVESGKNGGADAARQILEHWK